MASLWRQVNWGGKARCCLQYAYTAKAKGVSFSANPLNLLVDPERFERPTLRFVV